MLARNLAFGLARNPAHDPALANALMPEACLRRVVAKLTPADLAALRATGQTLDPAFQVGKAGVTDGVVKELQAHLSREPLVKVKIFASATEGSDTKILAVDLATRARVVLVEVRGHTALFHRPPRHKRDPEDF